MINFIETWENKISDETCDEIIEIFETNLIANPHFFNSDGKKLPRKNMQREDLSFDLNNIPNKKGLCNLLYKSIFECYDEYTNKYGQLLLTKHKCSTLKVQRTMPYGGYHIWHYEQSARSLDRALRELVWTIYLNTMPPNEAETEFLFQSIKIQPKKGTVCIFPAAMTHVHRGLTVYTQPKYIITGWFNKIVQD